MPAISQAANGFSTSTWTSVGAALAADSQINVYIVNKSSNAGEFSLAIHSTTPTGAEIIYYNINLEAGSTFVAADLYAKTGDSVYVQAPVTWSARVDGVTLE